MFMKSLKINNFRKFGTNNNTIEFVEASSYREESDEEEINLAPTTTLIVGKNNSGKTTITKALSKLINSKNFSANDFNFTYLDNLLGKYKELNNEGKLEKNAVLPVLEFKIIIGLEDETNNLVTNLASFMDIGNTNKSEVEIIVKYEIADRDVFIKNVKELLNKEMPEERDKFKKFLELIDGSSFKLNYYDTNGSLKEKFNLKDLIEIKTIKANKIESSKALSKSFSTIIKYRYIMDENKKNDLEDDIMDINKRVTSEITNTHTKNINKALGKIESNDKLEVQLSSDLTFKKLMNNLIRYEYIEQDHHIPEGQFGLGYTNLMAIIADIIDYIEKYPDKAFNSNINMISIEEPETFMHPQMQQLFIKHINDAVNYLLKRTGKNVNSQLVITTHSSNILNSKIHTGNTFNNITYVTIDNSYSDVVNLKDSKVEPNTETRENDLNFLKKHIKYKVSELFFSDSIIFVEGITEETLLNYYIDNDPELNKFYISIFNIDGAHGLVYHKLIKLLKVPTIIITDIDIKREDNEKEHFRQIQNISNRVT
ncbi:MAG: AAA family ATPase, partial [Candidatus Marinimicrobia bacterium]|nr:AAA family ATPase [Candidatus Neomarinimicrobiota bacterium]